MEEVCWTLRRKHFVVAVDGFGKASILGFGFTAKPLVALVELQNNIAVVAATGEKIGLLTFSDIAFDNAVGIVGIGLLETEGTIDTQVLVASMSGGQFETVILARIGASETAPAGRQHLFVYKSAAKVDQGDTTVKFVSAVAHQRDRLTVEQRLEF